DGGEAPGDGDAAVEALELGRDLSLVVVHAEHAVEVVAEALDEDRVGGEGAPARDAARRGGRDRRSDDLDLLAPEEPVLAAVRVEGGDRDARPLEARAAHRRVGERERLFDALLRDLLDRGAQRHVRSGARHPLVVQHVHLAEVAAVLREMGEHLVLVVELPAARVQRRLVEGREGDAVDAPRERELHQEGERLAGEAARFRRHLPARDARRVEVRQVEHRYLVGARPFDRLGGGIRAHPELHVRVARALLEHARVAHHEQAGMRRHAAVREDACALLRADAGAVAEHEAQDGKVFQALLRSVKNWIARIIAKVIASMLRARTAIGPQSLLSRRSNMVTDTVLVFAVKSRMVAESSRMEPMKMNIQVAITPLRMSGAVTSTSARIRVAPKMRLASSSSGCTDLRDELTCW